MTERTNFDELTSTVYKYVIGDLHTKSNDVLFCMVPPDKQEEIWKAGYHIEDIYQVIENLKELY